MTDGFLKEENKEVLPSNGVRLYHCYLYGEGKQAVLESKMNIVIKNSRQNSRDRKVSNKIVCSLIVKGNSCVIC